jgi:uncharacterized protein YeaO (DUF488 family)
MKILLKSVHDKIEALDGHRILVDEHLPSGLDEYKARIDMWPKEIAPSVRLKKILDEKTAKRGDFEKEYFKELDKEKELWVQMILDKAKVGTVTLLYTGDNPKGSNAALIRDYLVKNEDRLLKKAA